MSDIDNVIHEFEAGLVSGWPQYPEGNMIFSVELVNDDGNNTAQGEYQAESVFSSAVAWNVVERIRALVFDANASNTGRF